jgi:hypothetical protein
MRCYICNSILEDPQYNLDHEDYDPCPTCLAVIEDVFGYADQPAAGEEDLPDDPILEGLYPQSYEPFEAEENT